MSGVSNRRIVLTGATGTLGRNVLADLASDRTNEILCLARNSSLLPESHPNTLFKTVDFFDVSAIGRTVDDFKPSALIHCAATGMQQPLPGWDELIRFNVDVSVALCEATARVAGCHFIYVSTGLAYRNVGRALHEDDALDTQHPYGASKAAADILIRAKAAAAGVPVTVLRPFSFSGPGDVGSRLIPALLRAAAEKRPFALSPGDQVRDHCAVQDIARGIIRAAEKRPSLDTGAHVYNLGSGDTLTLRQLIERLIEELGLKVDLQFGARNYARFEPKFLVADIGRAIRELGWRPQINFAYAVWQLAKQAFPSLNLKEPKRDR